MVTNITYELDTPFDYAHKGEKIEASFIELKAPTSRNMRECAFLKQAFFHSLPDDKGEEDGEKGDPSAVSGSQVISMMYLSHDVDMVPVLGHAKELFTSGVAMVDGEEKLTKPLMDTLSQIDLENMLGDYLINFIVASALRKTKKQ